MGQPSQLLQLAYAAQKRLWRWLRPHTRGVKVMLFNDADELLLIRNAYGNQQLFVLPGGGMRPWENAAECAKREIREELGCAIDDLRPLAVYSSNAEGKRDTVHLFEGRCLGKIRTDDHEVAEARFFSLSVLPDATSPATLRRIDESSGKKALSEQWQDAGGL